MQTYISERLYIYNFFSVLHFCAYGYCGEIFHIILCTISHRHGKIGKEKCIMKTPPFPFLPSHRFPKNLAMMSEVHYTFSQQSREWSLDCQHIFMYLRLVHKMVKNDVSVIAWDSGLGMSITSCSSYGYPHRRGNRGSRGSSCSPNKVIGGASNTSCSTNFSVGLLFSNILDDITYIAVILWSWLA